MRKRSAGFNLVEIMIAMAIVAVMMALAAPNLRDFMRNASISALTNDMMADLQMARTEAVKAKRRAWFCVSDTGSEGVCLGGGWTGKYRAVIVDLLSAAVRGGIPAARQAGVDGAVRLRKLRPSPMGAMP